MAHIAEGNKAEMVIPLTNQNRALQLMYQALDYFKGNDSGSGSQKQLGGDNSILTDLLTKLLTATLQQNQILATELGKTPIVQISISDIMHAAAQYTSRKRAF
jgi:SLT domain-containing protein